MNYILILMVVFIATTLLVYQLHSQAEKDDVEKLAGLEEKRQWNKRTQLIERFYPLIKFIKPITDMLPVPAWVNENYSQWLITAGLDSHVRVKDLLGLQLILPLVCYFISRQFFDNTVLISLFTILGFFLPAVWVYLEAKERQQRITRELPSIVDMIALSVKAGLDFESSVKRIVIQSKRESDIIDELRVFVRNIDLGMSRSEALEEMAQRINTGELYSFVSVLIQADKMGAAISTALISQADKLREERFVKAEKAGAVASQKMMLPMMIFLFPLMFIIILAPFILKYIYD